MNLVEESILIAMQQLFTEEDFDDPMAETASRIFRYWRSLAEASEQPFVATTFPAIAQQLILVKDIEFASTCAHHLLPFYGVAHVGYLPHEVQIGVSKIPRAVEWYANRPQVQERLTHQVASWMQATLKPKGTAVLIRATHTCMACRGVYSRNAEMVTSELRGIFLTAMGPREEFFAIVGGGK